MLESYGYLTYALILLVTLLHEQGHALAALLTGGTVHSIEISANGAGLCTTSGGNMLLILMGGFVGSILLGNLMVAVSMRFNRSLNTMAGALAVILVVTAVGWSGNLLAAVVCVGFALLVGLASRFNFRLNKVMFLILGYGVIISALKDTVGPSSDIAIFSDITLLPESTVRVLFWSVAILLTGFAQYLTYKPHFSRG
jgi:hypothetical protein